MLIHRFGNHCWFNLKKINQVHNLLRYLSDDELDMSPTQLKYNYVFPHMMPAKLLTVNQLSRVSACIGYKQSQSST